MSEYALPNYLLAADNHNIANGGISWLNPSSWAEKLGNVGSYMVTSVLAGANGFYNTGVSVGRMFGSTAEDRDTATWIASYDDDLGKYYKENAQSVELGGFILGSLAPGFGGVAALRAGQAALGGAKIFNAGNVAFKAALMEGKIGSGMGRATGLLIDRTDDFLSLASKEINASTTAVKLLNANTAKAMASGFWQNTLEAAAFETAVQATMFRSPILEEQDLGDIVSNVMIGGAVGGVIGGAFGAAGLRGTLKKAMRSEDLERNKFIQRFLPLDKTPANEKAIQYAADVELAPVPIPVRAPDGTIINNFDAMNTFYQDRVTKAKGGFRQATHELTGNDVQFGNVIANMFMPVLKDGVPEVGLAQNVFNAYSGAVRITRPMVQSLEERKMAMSILKGKDPEQVVAPRWTSLFGPEAGKVYAEAPMLPTLGDYFSQENVLRMARRAEFKVPKVGVAPWSVLKSGGGEKAYLEVEKRYVWAHHLLKEVPDGAIIGQYDIPLLERVWADGKTGVRVLSEDGTTFTEITSKQQAWEILKTAKEDAASLLQEQMVLKKSGHVPQDIADVAIPRMVNVRSSYWEVGPSAKLEDDLLAMQGDFTRYKEQLTARGLSTSEAEVIDPVFLPKYAKIVYDVDQNLVEMTPNVLDGLVHYAESHRIAQIGSANVVARILGPIGNQIPEITSKDLEAVSRVDTGAGLVTADASRYGDVGSKASSIGAITRELKVARRKELTDALSAPLTKVGGKVEAAFEFEAFNQKASRSGQLWVPYEENGRTYMITKRAEKAFKDEEGVLDFDALLTTPGMKDDWHQFTHQETSDLVMAHISTTGKRTSQHGEINLQRGKSDNKDPRVYRPIRPDLKNYPNFAFVRDETVTGAGHMTMIHAATPKELQQMIDKVPARYKVLTKTEVENHHLYRGEYEYSRTLNENYIDSDMANAGVFSNFFPKSDPQKIIDDVLQQHYRESDTLVREAVRLKNEAAFATLEDMGKVYSRVETSRFASRTELLENSSQNPFFNHIKTALDITKINEYPMIYSANKLLDEGVSKAVAAIRTSFLGTKSSAELEMVNATLDRYGMKPAYYDAALQALANHTAPRGELTKFVRKANAILSQFTLGLDFLNALNNAIGSTMLRGTELKLVTRAIREGNSELAGDLAKIAKVGTPGAPGEILAPTKLVASATGAFFNKEAKVAYLAKYREMGLIKSRDDQLQMLLDDFTLKGTESVSELSQRIDTAYQRSKVMIGEGLAKGERLTGNIQAEEFNRFISANVMDQITAVAVKHGIMDDATARAYIRTFVNRVEGNIVASQRPLVFQGPIGQSLSLFQSYQFNLMQQLFRYVGEGKAKDLAMLAGLQSTLYGLQSMPAFQFMNVHIIGQLSGNKEHRDLYDATYGTVGRTAGNWLLYGVPSNFLQTNIYSRGDINPRHLTILPTTLQEIPFVQGWGKFFGSIYETTKKVAGGADIWESILQGVEHNGISRPLAGLAQVAQAAGPNGQVYSTTNQGGILYAHDLFHLGTLSRLAGGRPLDEAIANDAFFRVKKYEVARNGDLKALRETIKSSLIQGNQPDEAQIRDFAARYAEMGGKQKQFNKWMMDLYRSANESQAEKLSSSLSHPFAYKMQLLTGGDE